MLMKIAGSRLGFCFFCLSCLGATSVCQAEIYKWVDASGVTHYSERSDKTVGAKVVEIKAQSPSTSAPAPQSSQAYWQEQERRFNERQSYKNFAEQRKGPSLAQAPQSLSGGTAKWADNDEWRCNLARDILSGAVTRQSRAANDYERKLAEENVRAFCH
jgi:hypothetical protein